MRSGTGLHERTPYLYANAARRVIWQCCVEHDDEAQVVACTEWLHALLELAYSGLWPYEDDAADHGHVV